MSKAANRILKILDGLSPTEFKSVVSEVNKQLSGRKKIEQSLMAARTTPEAVWEKFSGSFERADPSPEEWAGIDEIRAGLRAVEFTMENAEFKDRYNDREWAFLLGPRMFGDVAGIGCWGGGDWEWPLFFIIYLGADGHLRSYIPKDGNTWNHACGAAFGNDDDQDAAFLAEWLTQNCPHIKFNAQELNPVGDRAKLMFDEQKILQDIAEHIPVSA